MDQEIAVSIHCLTYNHEKYVRKTLEGFVSQETTFQFEVLIHDDASTDSTKEIISEFALKYPDIIKPIIQKENQMQKHIGILRTYQIPRIKGRYVAYCEGDDYWTDTHKLQKQFDALESNLDCSMCTCRIRGIKENGELLNKWWPNFELERGKIDAQRFLDIRWRYPFQTSGYFVRTEYLKDYIAEKPLFAQEAGVGDEPLLLYAITRGCIYYLDDEMSCYRQMSIGSFSARNKSPDRVAVYRKKLLRMMQEFDKYTDYRFDCKLLFYEFKERMHTGHFKELLSPCYHDVLMEESLVRRLYIYLNCVFPVIDRIRHIRNR